MREKRCIIVGSGHAGIAAAESLRRNEFPGKITVVTAECGEPYQRPQLSKEFLAEENYSIALLRTRAYLNSLAIDLLSSTAVTGHDADRHDLYLAEGDPIKYDFLVIATGARARTLFPMQRAMRNVVALRTLADAERLKALLRSCERVTIIGGGFIGLEVASAAVASGRAVVIMEGSKRLMGRVISPAMSERFLNLYRSVGATVELGVMVEDNIRDADRIVTLRLNDGREVATDLIVVGIGAEPSVDFLDSGLRRTRRFLSVDKWLRTTDQNIWAVGDCAAIESPGEIEHYECVSSAVAQGIYVGASIARDELLGYKGVPWFWSTQLGHHLQVIGKIPDKSDNCITRIHQNGISYYHFLGETLVAVECLDNPREFMMIRKLFAHNERRTHDEVVRLWGAA